jgi:ABC-type amino acid transport substrate-binding protein
LELPKLALVGRSAAFLFREVGLAWIADGDTLEPNLLDTMCRDGTVWVAVDDTDKPVAFLAAHMLDEQFHIVEVSVARSHQRRGIGGTVTMPAHKMQAANATRRKSPGPRAFDRQFKVALQAACRPVLWLTNASA